MMKILVLGSSGALGQAVVNQLAPLPDVSLRVFDRGKAGVVYPKFVEHVVGDATKVEDLKAALQDVDVVFSTLGPMHVASYAKPVVAAVNATEGQQRLFWTTQFQIDQHEFSAEDFALAASFGFDEETERSYVSDQREGAEIIASSSVNSTLLMLHFFKPDQTIQHAVFNTRDEPISGGPISLSTLAIVIADILHHEEDFRQTAIKISALAD